MSDPMTPADCDLRGLPFMPLDVVRLGDSDLVALSTGDEFKAAVMLWCKSWLQVPAASLPDDDRILAHLSGTGQRWGRVKAVALRGWVLCTDGRLYHPVVAEKAREAWSYRLRQRERSMRANAVRWGDPPASPRGSPRASPDDPKGQGQGQRQGKKEDTSLRSVSPARDRAEVVDRDFEDFWTAYPRKVGKDAARKAWANAKKRASVAEIAAGLNAAQWNADPRYRPHPATWLNEGRWQDTPEDAAPEPEGRLDYLRDFMPTPSERVQ